MAKRHGVPLRQSYARLGKKALRLASRYAHARQMKRARREIRRLKTYLGRVFRDVRRKLEGRPEVAEHFAKALPRVERLLAQQRTDKNKLYALHAPEVACIAKGKAHKKYEFGAKVSVAVIITTALTAAVLPGTSGPAAAWSGCALHGCVRPCSATSCGWAQSARSARCRPP